VLTSAAQVKTSSPNTLPTELTSALRESGLRYVDDGMPGITRHKAGKQFTYRRPDGKPLRDADELARIRALAIPPAYTDVWICPRANGHLQATGRDARGRKQYRYHADWRALRDSNKYEHMLAFGKALPRIRRRLQRDLRKPPLSRDNVMATVVSLLERTLIRVGNEEYARDNESFGITTMRDRHVRISGSQVRFTFRGKSGKHHDLALNDARLAKIVKRCRDLPGQELFQYVDDGGERHSVSSSDVNAYLREITDEDFTAKDFRTWAGTVLTAVTLCSVEPAGGAPTKTALIDAIKTVSNQLGNTPAVCRRCYVHPEVIAAHLDGSLIEAFAKTPAAVRGLHRAESTVMALLRRRARVARKHQ
jgi:DNA topoisomerase-1